LRCGHVHHRPDEFSVARLVPLGRIRHDVQILDSAIGHQQPVFETKTALMLCRIDYLLDQSYVFRMRSLED
jgi:hypothetical protein